MPTFEFVFGCVSLSHEGKLGEVQKYLSWAISLTLVLQHKAFLRVLKKLYAFSS